MTDEDLRDLLWKQSNESVEEILVEMDVLTKEQLKSELELARQGTRKRDVTITECARASD